MKVKTNGLELQINEKGGKQFGDIFVTKTGIIWCKGKTTKPKGIKIDYETLNDICINLTAVKTHLKQIKKSK